MATVGIITNPAAGKDIRRLVSSASPTSDMAKMGIIRRAVIGAAESGVERILLANDRHSLGARAVADLQIDAELVVLDDIVIDTGHDSRVAAERCWKEGAGAVVVLGGDGTHRDVAKGWLDLPLVAVSTGTNNVFPRLVEATIAGRAAGLVATGAAPIDQVSTPAKVAHVRIQDGATGAIVDDGDDLALVDVALVEGRFAGSRAVWDPARLRDIVACIAEPDAVGLSSIAAAVHLVGRDEPGGMHVRIGNGRTVRVPIAPGLFVDIGIASATLLADGDEIELIGPGMLAFDGERDRALGGGQRATVCIRRDGPRVINIAAAMRWGRNPEWQPFNVLKDE